MPTHDAVTQHIDMRDNNKPNNCPSQDFLTLDAGANLKICHLNIEGICRSKSEYLARLMNDEEVDIIALQETHTLSDENLQKRCHIPGYYLIDAIHSRAHGIATFAKTSIRNCRVTFKDYTNNVYVLAVEVHGITIINVYKPPSSNWIGSLPKLFPHPAIYVGDFNSHNQAWGYKNNDNDGVLLQQWITLNNLHLIYSPKEKGTFNSARWRKGYTPDLTITTRNPQSDDFVGSRHIIKSFPNSQHRPVLYQHGIQIPLVSSIPKARWNFRRADWDAFTKDLDHVIQFLPARPESYERFASATIAAAKRHIPRGFREAYIPGWNQRCNDLYDEYNTTYDTNVASQLLKALDEQRRERWQEVVETMDFKHSSRKAWAVLRKLGGDSKPKAPSCNVPPNDVAARLLLISRAKVPKEQMRSIKEELRKKRKTLQPHPVFSRPFTMDELSNALTNVNTGKAAGLDGIYPEFIKNSGNNVKQWLIEFFNNILQSGRLPKLFKRAKTIAILKPGKDGSDAAHYRPITLLSVVYKLLERIILQRVQPALDEAIPINQAGFRKDRNCTEQVMAITTHIEAGFQRQLKTGVVFVDLTAAYDTVWKDGLLLKFINIIPCAKISNLLNNMLANRFFQVSLGEKQSRWRRLNEGLPQGSVMAPTLFNLYVSDIPSTRCKIFQYADDLALTTQAKTMEACEVILEEDLQIMNDYFRRWRLQPNATKTEVCAFHLNNKESQKQLRVHSDGILLQHNQHPKYLGVTLDRTLTFKQHLEKTARKVGARTSIIQKLAGTGWGANVNTLRSASLALVYSTAEYCAPVWLNSAHVSKVDVQINNAMRLISGTVKSTESAWLPVITNIPPPELRREAASVRELEKCRSLQNSMLYDELLDLPTSRLKSRKPPWRTDPALTGVEFKLDERWQEKWTAKLPANGYLVDNPNIRLPGFDLSRRDWTTLNRFRTAQGRCADILHKWGMQDSPACDCGAERQTMRHIIVECPLRSFKEGLNALHQVTSDAVRFLQNLDITL